MLVFAHAGITLGTARIISAVITRWDQSKIEVDNQLTSDSKYNPTSVQVADPTIKKISWITNLAAYVDIRLLLIASLLPDIIDKPIGQLIFKQTFNNGRIFGHTLLFLIVITVFGLIIFRFYRKTWLLVLAFGTFMHLILDQMWHSPNTLLWPIYGTSFPKIDLSNWLSNMINMLLMRPIVALPEILGMVIIAFFCIELLRKNSVLHFVRYGKLR